MGAGFCLCVIFAEYRFLPRIKAGAGFSGSCPYDGGSQRKRDAAVPEVYVHAVKGRTAEQNKRLAQVITASVTKRFNAPADAVVVSIIETEASSKSKGGVMFSELRR